MGHDTREVLEALRFELDYVRAGGYGRSPREPHLPRAIFADSPICLNFGDPARPLPCKDCLLMQFVPEERRNERVPCHQIPLNASGATVASAFDYTNETRVQDLLEDWLQETITQLEEKLAAEDTGRVP